MDLKKSLITGAVGGIVASLVFGKRHKTLEHSVKYAALGAGVMAAGSYAMKEFGGHHTAGYYAGLDHADAYGLSPTHSPAGYGHGGNWGNPADRHYFRQS